MRMRRTRRSAALRALVAESSLGPADLIYPVFVLDGENRALAVNDKSIIIRTSWVYSEYGANFVKTMLRLAVDRDELNIVADQIGGPTAARDIA